MAVLESAVKDALASVDRSSLADLPIGLIHLKPPQAPKLNSWHHRVVVGLFPSRSRVGIESTQEIREQANSVPSSSSPYCDRESFQQKRKAQSHLVPCKKERHQSQSIFDALFRCNSFYYCCPGEKSLLTPLLRIKPGLLARDVTELDRRKRLKVTSEQSIDSRAAPSVHESASLCGLALTAMEAASDLLTILYRNLNEMAESPSWFKAVRVVKIRLKRKRELDEACQGTEKEEVAKEAVQGLRAFSSHFLDGLGSPSKLPPRTAIGLQFCLSFPENKYRSVE
ncbi:hypothetical protein VNO77_46282 [Canavalia gladiata]|uniref:Uncharacterized protein n=1 Tax=Canavalia gladiata TaxID=3824 RepID=A0AAN9JKH1_CANGL